MSLKVKSVHYDTVHLSSFLDIDVFTEELKSLISSGFTVACTVRSESTILHDFSALFKHSMSRHKYDIEDGSFCYTPSSAAKTESTGGC